jgi:hypothetical protein
MGALIDLRREFRGSEFGDRRLSRRLQRLGMQIGSEPEASFPASSGNDSDLEATYRFLNNERVTAEQIMSPHVAQTVRRADEGERLVVAHDTSEFNFGKGSRRDLGRVGRGKSFGFYGHFALAVESGLRRPLGVLGFEIHSRRGDKGRRGHIDLQTDPNNESRRWFKLIERAQREIGERSAIHVMDREADSYSLMAALAGGEFRFVIRMAGAKRATVGADETTVGEVLQRATVVAQREVKVSARGRNALPSYRKHHPERSARVATLQVSSSTVTLKRPESSSKSPDKTLTLNVVRVLEVDPPEGETPIEWRLWTTEPVQTAAEALAVVDAYRCRWVIEEYFKALKTGCAVESRQLETHDALVNMLALFVPVAWRLLLLRTLSRDANDTPATSVLSAVQLRCLAGALVRLKRPRLPSNPTVRDSMLGVAGLGGHIKNNGDPGWNVLGRGLDKLLTIELGYRLATDEM